MKLASVDILILAFIFKTCTKSIVMTSTGLKLLAKIRCMSIFVFLSDKYFVTQFHIIMNNDNTLLMLTLVTY